MGVSFEPSIGDSLAHPLQEFVSGLADYLKPNHDFQKGMQKAISANPQLAQNLADLEYNAPGTLNSMGFGSLGDILKKIPESAQSQFQRQNKPEIVGNEAQKLHLEGAQTGFAASSLDATKKYLMDNPSEVNNMIHYNLFKQTIDQAKGVNLENQIKTEEVKNVAAEAALRQAELPGKIAKAAAEKDLEDQLAAHPELQKYDVMDVARKMIKGQSIPNLQLFMKTDGGKQALDIAVKIQEMQLQRDNQDYLRMMMHRGISAEEKANISAAKKLLDTTHAGTLTSTRVSLEDPAQVQAVQDKFKTGGLAALTQSEKDILASENAKQGLVSQQQSKELGAKNIELIRADQAARVAIKGGDPAEIEKNLSLTNNIFAQKAQQSGGELFQAVYGAIPPVGKKVGEDERRLGGALASKHGLYYVNSDGVRVEDSAPFKLYQGGLSSAGLDFLQRFNSPQATPAIKAAALDRLKKERPEVYKEIQSKIPK